MRHRVRKGKLGLKTGHRMSLLRNLCTELFKHGRIVRHMRIRKKLSGDETRPRVSVYRSNQHIYAQVIDDINSRTLVSAASIEPQIRNEHSSSNKSVIAKAVGELLAKRLQENGIKKLVFDRGGYKFHGRVKALADGVKSMGVQI